MTPNPLQKYFRQPKIYITLPSKGLYYEAGAFQGDYNQVPIFSMTGMDELIFKTPDALFSGESTKRVVESCCPYIKNANQMPSIDLDAVLIGIKIATFGDTMTVTQTCKNCGTENDYEVGLSQFLEYFSSLKFVNNIQISETLSIKIRPLQFEEMNYFSIENFKLQKTLYQTVEIEDDQKQEVIDKIYKDLSELQLQLFLTSIESVNTPDGSVTEKPFIEDWLRNAERGIYNSVKAKMEENKEAWSIPPQLVKCGNCGSENSIQVTLDQSNFFV